jgi:uncharacterized protein YhhL (DUF1145 family)
MIVDTLKGAALLVYAVALATLAGWLEGPLATGMSLFAGVMLLVHALEVPFVLASLRRHRGPLAASIALNLLFGLLHWMPLRRAARSGSAEAP